MTGHPIRNAVLHIFERVDTNDGGVQWLGRFHPYKTYPVLFSGASEQAVIEAAEEMRADAIEKHEAACIARQEAKEKAAEKRAKKKGAL